MAYRLELAKSVPGEIKRVVFEEIDSAVENLEQTDPKKRDSSIHEARKSIKKIRGVLRLMRPQLGGVYRKENKRLRNIGRRLSALRDARVMIDAFDILIAGHKRKIGPGVLKRVRQSLLDRKRQTEEKAGTDEIIHNVVEKLRATRDRVEQWPLHSDGFKAVAPGLETTFRDGRKALQEAKRHPTDENYHELRKRVKDHWYHVRLLQNLWAKDAESPERELKALEDSLGEDHNLVLLRDVLHQHLSDSGDQKHRETLLSAGNDHQNKFRTEALSLADKIYARNARRLVKDFKADWDARGEKTAASNRSK